MTDSLEDLVSLSNLLGQETRLVQPGGGNTSAKLRLTGDNGEQVQALAVKGSGTDLRTIGRDGFTWLSLARLAPLRHAETMSDAEMMRFMAGCMLGGSCAERRDPAAFLIPHRVIAHTHDVATMSLTNVTMRRRSGWSASCSRVPLCMCPSAAGFSPGAGRERRMVDRIPATPSALRWRITGSWSGGMTPPVPCAARRR